MEIVSGIYFKYSENLCCRQIHASSRTLCVYIIPVERSVFADFFAVGDLLFALRNW